MIDQPDGVPVETQSERAKDAVLAAFDAREDMLLRNATDAKPMAYYRVIVFSCSAQADAFMQAIGENPEDQYFDGRRVADRLGIAIPADVWSVQRRVDAKPWNWRSGR